MTSWNTGDDAADGLSNSRPTEPPRVETHNAVPGNSCHASMRSAVTLVVPCFNEEAILPRLRWVLSDLAQSLAHRYQFEFLLVDDGSTDETPRVLGREFGDEPNCRILTHETNRGIAAAIMTGIRQARSEIVCSMDCDCSYDPIQLEQMIPLLSDDVDLVTASPYHPQGRVLNVPRHRLAMSKAASFLYRRAMRPRLYCYTSCFRVYRRSTVKDVRLDHGGFPGIAELVWQLGRRDAHIVEHPAVLEVNSQRVSKMKISSTVVRHLKLLGRALMDRRRVGLVGSNDARHPPDSKHDLPT